MKIFFIPLHYLDDRLLVDAHRGFHNIETVYKKNQKTTNKVIRFIYDYKDRINWFHDYHERLVTEMNFRFGNKPHKSPITITPHLKYKTWIPPLAFIDEDIEYLKHRYKFSNKQIKYTKRNFPDFLINIERNINAICDTCIYFKKEYDNKPKKCFNTKLRKANGFCERWVNEDKITYSYSYKNQLLKDLFGGK